MKRFGKYINENDDDDAEEEDHFKDDRDVQPYKMGPHRIEGEELVRDVLHPETGEPVFTQRMSLATLKDSDLPSELHWHPYQRETNPDLPNGAILQKKVHRGSWYRNADGTNTKTPDSVYYSGEHHTSGDLHHPAAEIHQDFLRTGMAPGRKYEPGPWDTVYSNDKRDSRNR